MCVSNDKVNCVNARRDNRRQSPANDFAFLVIKPRPRPQREREREERERERERGERGERERETIYKVCCTTYLLLL